MGLQTIRRWHLARLVRLASSDPSLPPCYFSGVQLHLVWHHSARAATGDVHLCSAALCQLGHYNQNETQQKPMDPASRQAYGNAEGAAKYSTPPLTNIRAAENPERAVSATSPVIVFETGRVRRRCDCGAQDPWPGLQPGLHEEVFASRKGFRKLPCARPLPRMGRRMTRTPQTRPRGASSLL